MNRLLNDVKYCLRQQRKSRGFVLVALLMLTLCIGASTAVFSVVDTIMLKPLPYANADRIVMLWRLTPKQINVGYGEIPWGIANFQQILRDSKVFTSLGAFKSDHFNLTGFGEPAMLDGVRASVGFFPALGVQPIIGRTFTPQEDQPGHEGAVILSYDLWQDRFHGDAGVLGWAVNLNGKPHVVVGVMPAGFAFPRGEEMPESFGFPRRPQLWIPSALPEVPAPAAPDELAVAGRLKDVVTPAQAQVEMNTLAARMEQDSPGNTGWFNSRVTRLQSQVAGNTRTPLLLTLGAVGVVLLIACSNIANLLLARSLGRRPEFALRAALGAGRGRLIRQLLTESLMLAIAGGIAGILLAQFSLSLLKVLAPANLPRIQEVDLDWRVFGFALGITFASGIVFGMAPAISATRNDLASSLQQAGRTGSHTIGPKIRNTFLVLEVALALVLAVASALLVQTFFRLLTVDPGFNAARALTFELSLPVSKYNDDNRIVALYQNVLRSLQTVPGVESAAIVGMPPLEGAVDGSLIRIPERPVARGKDPFVSYSIASPGYFSTIGTPVLRGREFLETDTANSRQVALISRTMARTFWPTENPIGKRFGLADPSFPLMTVVGIVGDVKHLSLREEAGPEVYVPYTQRPFTPVSLMYAVVRSKSDPALLVGNVRAAIRSLDPDLPIGNVATLREIVDASLAGQRFSMLVLGAFAAISLLLAFFGVYGVISYLVGQRTREIGIRIALGARSHTVLGMLMGYGARLAGLGVALGLLMALGLTRLIKRFLFGVPPTDAFTFAIVASVLMAVALLACYLPARRAMRIDPIVALRHE
jgi:putative ABC transport system permease protein